MAAPEFSRPVIVSALRPGGEHLSLEATEAERAALGSRLGVEGVRSLSAALEVRPGAKGIVSVRGRLRATLDRLCVVTLEPLVEEIDEPFSVLFRPEGGDGRRDLAEVSLDVAEADEEPYSGAAIDLGEHVAQTLALALDPWPRAPGAALPDVGET